jgi:Transposase DDE domain group 1
MTDDTPLPFDLPSVRRKKLTVDFAGGNQSSNGGVLLLREAERKHGVCLRLAEAMPDRRDPDRIRHAMFRISYFDRTAGRRSQEGESQGDRALFWGWSWGVV